MVEYGADNQLIGLSVLAAELVRRRNCAISLRQEAPLLRLRPSRNNNYPYRV